MTFFGQAKFARGASSLRETLREGTRTDHERLDAELESLDLADRADYVRFLRFHAVARAGVEQWLADNAPPGIVPPGQLDLVRADLAALGEPVPACAPAFSPEEPGGWLGVAYVVAGSHLGNRVLLGQLAQPLAHAAAFLRGEEMAGFWRAFRALLDQPLPKAETARSLAAARNTFAHFSRVAATTGAVLPA